MCRLTQITFLTVVSVATLPLLSVPAYANPGSASDLLLPQEGANITVELDPASLQPTLEDVDNAEPSNKLSPVTSQEEAEGFFNDLVDENGGVNLPLGITVFSTLGDPSIGFGGNFK
ncbi:MAG: hypothetical protein AAFX01_04375 [Cyanobacteria bacterium J06638_28]